MCSQQNTECAYVCRSNLLKAKSSSLSRHPNIDRFLSWARRHRRRPLDYNAVNVALYHQNSQCVKVIGTGKWSLDKADTFSPLIAMHWKVIHDINKTACALSTGHSRGLEEGRTSTPRSFRELLGTLLEALK